MNVSEAIAYRRSVRGFTDQAVDPALVKDIVEKSARAATGGNLQPWHIDIVHGDALDRLKAIMRDKMAEGPSKETVEYNIIRRSYQRRTRTAGLKWGKCYTPASIFRGKINWGG